MPTRLKLLFISMMLLFGLMFLTISTAALVSSIAFVSALFIFVGMTTAERVDCVFCSGFIQLYIIRAGSLPCVVSFASTGLAKSSRAVAYYVTADLAGPTSRRLSVMLFPRRPRLALFRPRW